jgi:hypothetical protein
MGDHILRQLPIGRFGTSEKIAKAALFFTSDDSSIVLGTERIADGAWRPCKDHRERGTAPSNCPAGIVSSAGRAAWRMKRAYLLFRYA